MLSARVIPCLDVHAGRVVKGVNFVNLIDAGDPVEQARIYDAAGADELCFLDITATYEGRETIYEVIARTADACFMPHSGRGRTRCFRFSQIAALRGRQDIDKFFRGKRPGSDFVCGR